MFEIGVKVKESTILTVDVSKIFLKDTLASHMRPVQKLNESIDALEKAIKSQISEGIKE